MTSLHSFAPHAAPAPARFTADPAGRHLHRSADARRTAAPRGRGPYAPGVPGPATKAGVNPITRRHWARADHDAAKCRLLQSATAAAFGIALDDMRAPSRGRAEVAFARQSAMYLAHVVFGLTFSAVGTLFNRDRTTAAHACHRVEDRRDDPDIDRLLQKLENVCLATAIDTPPPVCA